MDDVWALILFSLGMATMSAFHGNGDGLSSILLGVYQIFGAVLLGITLGVPGAQLTGSMKLGEPTLVEALGRVCVRGTGTISGCVLSDSSNGIGAVIANAAKHH
ncbi:MAG: NhaP-type Na+/H+ or K+/H+ antiporter [Paraglaciecola sp.]|jgi:NhaP-type Na+/H+ or K+/H+ antiporter